MGALSALGVLTLVGGMLCGSDADTTLTEAYRIGKFQNAVRLVVLPSGEMLVTDAATETVLHLAAGGDLIRSTGGFGWAEGSFDGISGIASDGIVIDVADRQNHRIQRFDRRLTPLSVLSTRDTSAVAARFGFPSGVAITPFGDRLIIDGENQRLVKFFVSGRFDDSFLPSKATSRSLLAPSDIAVAPSGNIAVLERGDVRLFDAFGAELGILQHAWLDSSRGLTLTDEGCTVVTDRGLLMFGSNGGRATEIALDKVLWSSRPEELRDVAVSGARLYLLTTTEVIVCSMNVVQ